MGSGRLTVRVSTYVDEDTTIDTAAVPSTTGGSSFARISFCGELSEVKLCFFDSLAGLDRTIAALQRVRHEFAELIENEPTAETAEQDQVTTHAIAVWTTWRRAGNLSWRSSRPRCQTPTDEFEPKKSSPLGGNPTFLCCEGRGLT